MSEISEKNRKSWNEGAAAYSALTHSPKAMRRIEGNPSGAFHAAIWEWIRLFYPDMSGLRVCVPSSGDNHAVFAFAMLGAQVTSCDISENQLENAKRVASRYPWGKAITFLRADTMRLDELPENAFDFVYTSNGVHVWINDLAAMYSGISRILKPGGMYILFDIHPFLRPFEDGLKIVKPYDSTGPFESDDEVNFMWRMMDMMNAIIDSGLTVARIQEMFAEKDYDWPFWIPLNDLEKGVTATREEVDRMYDWHTNPIMALPSWVGIAAKKPDHR